jgi:hypothetical protein
MRLLHKAALNKKLSAVALPRNLRMQGQSERVHTMFALTPLYLGMFFNGIAEDYEAANELRMFAAASEEQLDTISQMLVFWWFYALDRFEGQQNLSNPDVREGLRNIWGFSEEGIERSRMLPDATPEEELVPLIFSFISRTLRTQPLNLPIVSSHLHRAQMRALRDPEGAVRELRAV